MTQQTTTPKDIAGRTPGSSGDAAQKFRLDALLAFLDRKVDADTALDLTHYATTGEMPDDEEAPDGD